MAKIDAFFNLMLEQKASDLHMASGNPPMLRINGELQRGAILFEILTLHRGESSDVQGFSETEPASKPLVAFEAPPVAVAPPLTWGSGASERARHDRGIDARASGTARRAAHASSD